MTGEKLPRIPHAGCSWEQCIDRRDGVRKADHLFCPACGEHIPATPEQIKQAVRAEDVYQLAQDHARTGSLWCRTCKTSLTPTRNVTFAMLDWMDAHYQHELVESS
jgi:hypothetical protein